MPGRTLNRRLTGLAALGALALSATACASTPSAAVKLSSSASASATATATPSASGSNLPTASASPTPEATPAPTATPSDADPAYVPALASIQMVGPRTGWVAGSHAIYATTDGSHWTKQFGSTNDYIGVDFISQTTGWVVGLHELLGTTDGGHSWHLLGEAKGSLRSVHFASATRGWGIAGGSLAQPEHGTLLPEAGGTLVTSQDGGRSWTVLSGPADAQSVCFSDPAHGWLATSEGVVYQSADGGQTWTQSLSMFTASSSPEGHRTRIQCASPSAAWVYLKIENGAGGHIPYIVYSTQDGRSWRTVMTEPFTIGNSLPGVAAGPDSEPGSFSVVGPLDAVFIGDGPATNVSACVIANAGGATLRRTGKIDNSGETFGAAFTAVTTGWVLTRSANGDFVIDATTDGGYHWSQQLAVAPTSAG